MKEASNSDNQVAGDEYHVALMLRVLVATVLAVLVYWLVLSQGERIAGALAVTVFAAVLWISEALPLPVTAILIPVGLAIVGVFEVNTAFLSFGSPVLFLVLGGYALAVAVEVNGVDRWLARRVLGLAGNRSISLLAAFMLISAGLSMFISNTATTALLLPVAIGIINRHQADENLSRVLLLGVAYGASIGGVATLIGSPPNAIAAGLLGISYLEWLAYGLPISLTMLLLSIPLLWWIYRPEHKQISIDLGEALPMSTTGKRTLWVIAFTLVLWLFGPMLGTWLGLPAALFSAEAVAMIAIGILIVTACVNWKALEKGIHWGVLLLMGGGLTLGRGLTESGASNWLAGLLTDSISELPLIVLLLIIVSIGVFITELISNTAVTAKLAPILMGVALQLGLEADSLVVPVAIASSMAFMLPVATPPNALVHASGYISQRDMMHAGLRLNIVAILVITVLFHFGVAG
jgi:sodium-dependent dicarboxylate transporter 2/3/5